jgi:hypothetical protein
VGDLVYKVDIENKNLIELSKTNFSQLNLKERYDIEEWIEKSPTILGEELLIINKELTLPSGIRLDLLAIDKKANLVVIELKRDDSGRNLEWQSIKYVSYCSNFLVEDIFKCYAEYLGSDEDEAQLNIEEFIDEEMDKLNENQRIILVSKEFHSDVVSAVLWLRDYKIDIECVRLIPYLDQDEELFITTDMIIPLPEAKDYIEKKEIKQKESRSHESSYSLEKTDYGPEEFDKLEERVIKTLKRKSDQTPRFIAFLEIISSENKVFKRDEVKSRLYEKGIGSNIGQTGRYLSNISQFLTKKSNPHIRQIINFKVGSSAGETKDDYFVIEDYRDLLKNVLSKVKNKDEGKNY